MISFLKKLKQFLFGPPTELQYTERALERYKKKLHLYEVASGCDCFERLQFCSMCSSYSFYEYKKLKEKIERVEKRIVWLKRKK